jgi:transposase
MGRVIIGMDPHKRSATIEIIDDRETVLVGGRFGTDRDGYKAMLALGRRYPERIWAVEGCNGIGRHIAQRLVCDGETVVDVPAKLSARARVFATGQVVRPTRSTPTASPWRHCVPRVCGLSRSMM